MCSALEFSIGKVEHLIVNLEQLCSILEFRKENLNISSEKIEHLYFIGQSFGCPFLLLCAQPNRSRI